MKRLTLLALAGDAELALRQLRELGVVHVTSVRPPAGEDLDRARSVLDEVRRALTLIPASQGVDGGTRTPQEVVGEALALAAERRELDERRSAARRELARYAPFGEFDPRLIDALAAGHIIARLAIRPAGATATMAGVSAFIVGADREHEYVCLIGEPGQAIAELPDEWVEVPRPERSLEETRRWAREAQGARDEIEARLAGLTTERWIVERARGEAEDAVELLEIQRGMGEAEQVVYLQGFVPIDACSAVSQAAEGNGWGVVFADPERSEAVPTLLRYKRWIQPVRAVFDFLRIYPGYWESDVGWVFLLFFSVFFAMLVGDAGYGVLVLGTAVVLRRRLPRAPAHVFHMAYIVGVGTIIWGVLSGRYFGIPQLPGFVEGLKVDWLADRDNVIQLCFLIGAVHLTIAHVWNAVLLWRSRVFGKLLAQAGWILVVWSMLFLARRTVLGLELPGFVLYMLIVGVVLVALFMADRQEFRRQRISHALLPLTFVGNFVDILSYIRLFAVGYASVAVIDAFNMMASSIGFDSAFTAIAAVILLLFAHALNLVLCALGVLVHAVRLNTLEFSTHKGLAWEGHILYRPFAARREPA